MNVFSLHSPQAVVFCYSINYQTKTVYNLAWLGLVDAVPATPVEHYTLFSVEAVSPCLGPGSCPFVGHLTANHFHFFQLLWKSHADTLVFASRSLNFVAIPQALEEVAILLVLFLRKGLPL